ncbi:TRAP transporter small permease [Acuticoccus sp. MNP-M23]|uniref:TRAP transporter small permease n=1 Tax=Acuticoccus sp. MNP-M23 TaxID=3072793 RepID=UPI00281621B7|nr:TRAP transporter small permease [Acuticoccus sp. MNP-M23]WMS43007.1 TRAP transporter small permease [Acuticoccus sp. MNP-M23]
MLGLLGRFTTALSLLAAWLLFATGAMLTYEVVARYFFNAPTIWAEELSRLCMIWAVFIGSAGLLYGRDHIRVTVLVDQFPVIVQRICEVVSLVFVAVISGFVAWFGAPAAINSFEVGRTTGSMLDMPSWWMQAAVPIGFALLCVQALALAVAVIAGAERPAAPVSHEA